MIYLFGDSWGFSYKQVAPQTVFHDSQVFDGQDLACLMSTISNAHVCNLAKRGMDLSTVITRITKSKELFAPGDTLIVLQTEPFRSYFVKWFQREMINHDIKIESPMSYIDVCEEKLLEPFYRKLVLLEKMFNVNIILHGGLSKINHSRAEQLGLNCTQYSSTEVIANHLEKDFQDNYFVGHQYTLDNHNYLKEHYEHYVKEQDLTMFDQATTTKRMFWDEHPEYFTHDHTTEKGTRLVAEYLCDYLKNRELLHN